MEYRNVLCFSRAVGPKAKARSPFIRLVAGGWNFPWDERVLQTVYTQIEDNIPADKLTSNYKNLQHIQII